MSAFYVAAGSVAITSSLILVGALAAAWGDENTPHAQMNRAHYDEIVVRVSPYVPRHTARHPVATPPPYAQMNRALYDEIVIRVSPEDPRHAARRPVATQPPTHR